MYDKEKYIMKNIFSSGTLKIQILTLVAFFGSLIGISLYGVSISSLMLILLGYFLYGCLGVVITFHRLLTHNSYKTYKLVSKLFSILGCLGGTGSPIAWVAIHVNHHLNSDKINDPHSPSYKGMKIFLLDYEKEINPNTKWRMKNLIVDTFQQLLHRYYFLILFSWSGILYIAGGFYLVIFLHWIPMLITGLMSNVVNYIGHSPAWPGGYRRYHLNDCSTNNWIWAIPSWGETWHNNHHRHPKNFSCGEKWWEVDISALIIKMIKTS